MRVEHGDINLYRKYIDLVKLLNIYLNHFPRHEKYALALSIRQTAYTVYDLITECEKRYYKKTSLSELDIAHEKLRMLLHLANELGYFSFKDGSNNENVNPVHRYLAISNLVDETGRMIGGWIKKLKEEGNFK
jgi:four helix bundle protein